MLSRRQVLTGLPALAALHAPLAQATTRCAPADAQGIQQCVSGLEIGSVQTVRQRCREWCWAACIQAVFSLQGRELEQEQAVDRLFGNRVCRAATGPQIVNVINGDWIDQYGLRFRARAEMLRDAALVVSSSRPFASAYPAADMATALMFNQGARQLVAELDGGNPLIIGALGHATVLTAATYWKHRDGTVGLSQLIVRDPWPDNPNRRELAVSEVRDAFFVCRIRIQK